MDPDQTSPDPAQSSYPFLRIIIIVGGALIAFAVALFIFILTQEHQNAPPGLLHWFSQ